jgi:hypothetical protein
MNRQFYFYSNCWSYKYVVGFRKDVSCYESGFIKKDLSNEMKLKKRSSGCNFLKLYVMKKGGKVLHFLL